MTMLRVLVQADPNAFPAQGQSLRVRRWSDGAVVAHGVGNTDDQGFFTWQTDGSPDGFVYIAIEGVAGGGRYWDQRDAFNAGAVALSDIPTALSDLEGVVTGLTVTAIGDTVVVEPGVVVLGSVPVVFYTSQTLALPRPTTSTRVDRIVTILADETTPTPGGSRVLRWPGDVVVNDAGYTVRDLAEVTVPVAGPITVTDTRRRSRAVAEVAGEARAALAETTNTSGAALLTVNLDLPEAATYDVTADLSAYQDGVAAFSGWAQQESHTTVGSGYTGPTPTFLGIAQIALNAAGTRLYVADNANARLVCIDPTTWTHVAVLTGLPHVLGVCVDAAGNVYVAWSETGAVNLARYSADLLTPSWVVSASGVGAPRHLATDGVTLYVAAHGYIMRWICATGISTAPDFGGFGSGNGQFTFPFGVGYDPVMPGLYVSDFGAHRVQLFSASGTYIKQHGSLGTGPTNLQNPQPVVAYGEGAVLIGDVANNRVVKVENFLATPNDPSVLFTTPNPTGIAVAPNGDLWVSDYANHVLQRWRYVTTPAGYGEIAVGIQASVSPYLGLGNLDGEVANAHTGTIVGPYFATITGHAKAVSGTLSLRNAVLSARAIPRR